MKVQNSFVDQKATLYIVPTPIGNLEEMTPRAISVLKNVNYIACEDTRTSKILLEHFNIMTKCIAHHSHNQGSSIDGILKLLAAGENVALISDAGYPLISDPGSLLAAEVIDHGFHVVSLSGASAVLNALVVSGLLTQPFCFYGFLPSKNKALINTLVNLKKNPMTYIFYISVHDLVETLHTIYKIWGNCQVALARELTKRYEQILRGKLSELLEFDITLKGEFVLVISLVKDEFVVDDTNIIADIKNMLAENKYKKEIIEVIKNKYNVKKNYVYDLINQIEVERVV